MDMILRRKWATGVSTVGELEVDGQFECYTLEDVVRGNEPKVYGKTAIPAGTYKVTVTFSNRFQKPMPLLHDVPGFEGVRIHSGNTSQDTEGCILVGRVRESDRIGESKLAFKHLFPQIQEAVEATLQVLDVPEELEESPKEVLNEPSPNPQTSDSDSRMAFWNSLLALIASLLESVRPQPKQP